MSSEQISSSAAASSTTLPMRQTPLTCSGHTRPVTFLAFSDLNPEDEAAYYVISACKGEREWFNATKNMSCKGLRLYCNTLQLRVYCTLAAES
jgi:hypothetical protein